jgi:hypothetical protein
MYGACADQTGAVGNISADPLFSSGVGDVNPFQLTLSSPAVDAGDNLAPGLPALDVLGQPRIQNAKGLSSSIVDMGAYEFRGVPAPPSPAPDLTVTASPSSLTVVQGQSGRVSVTVTPTSGSLGTVLLTCSGLPASASCTLSPSLMNFTTTSPQSSTLTIGAGMASANLSRVPSPNSSHSMVLAGLFLIPTLFAGKRRSSDKGRAMDVEHWSNLRSVLVHGIVRLRQGPVHHSGRPGDISGDGAGVRPELGYIETDICNSGSHSMKSSRRLDRAPIASCSGRPVCLLCQPASLPGGSDGVARGHGVPVRF